MAEEMQMPEETNKLREMAIRIRSDMNIAQGIADGFTSRNDLKAKLEADNLVASLEAAANDSESLADRIEVQRRMEDKDEQPGI